MTSANNQSFGYSAANRLTSATGAYGAQSWVFDGVGNRTSQTIAGATSTYTYPATNNKLQSISGATARSFTYDGAGNIATDELDATGATLRERPGAGADMNRSDFNLAAGDRTAPGA